MAWNWEQAAAPYWRRPHEEVYRFLPELLDRPGRRALDLGCGIGRHLVYLAENGFDVRGCDLSPGGVDECRRVLGPLGLGDRVVLADMRRLPYPDAAFDVVVAVHVLYHCAREDVSRALAEARRVLAPGGLLLATFNDRGNSSYGRGREVEPHTFVRTEGLEAGIPHHYVDRAALLDFLGHFRPLHLSLKRDERVSEGIEPSAHWWVLAERP